MLERIPENQWKGALQAFTQRNAGRTTIIEEEGPEIGAHELEHGIPLRGVAYDERDGRVEIMLGDLEGTEHHLTHMIPGVTEVDFVADTAGHETGLCVRRRDGETFLRFRSD